MCSTGSLKTLNFFWFCQVLSGVAMGTHRERFSSFFHPFLSSFLFCSFFFCVCVCVFGPRKGKIEKHIQLLNAMILSIYQTQWISDMELTIVSLILKQNRIT
jgi:hypothetical protein